MPPAAPLVMPEQDLDQPAAGTDIAPGGRTIRARIFVVAATVLMTGAGVVEMVMVVSAGGITGLEWPFLIFFSLTFGWIAHAAVSAIAGVIWRAPVPVPVPVRTQEPQSRDGAAGKTAIVMPVYNEDAARTGAALQAIGEDLADMGNAGGFEIVILSDSTDPDAWVRETLCVQRLRAALDGIMPVWYRRRWRNTGRKAGNIAQFLHNWGARYDFMVVLDADSTMSGAALLRLTGAMRANPRLGIMQTSPQLAGGESLFARAQQFASWLYGPVVARGIAAWSGNEGNYWGHNAILRIAAFASACGLPELKGRKPFGGHILSHDFVEAAFMRRAGWAVHMDVSIAGSYEESPPSLIDVAARDRRWAQGNLQHLGVMGARGLAWPNRAHFAIGIMSYISSPLWLALIVTGFGLALQAHFIRPEYFSADYQLFPTWPSFDAERMLRIFFATMAVLLLPKFIGLAPQLIRPAPGIRRLEVALSALFEILLSALYAPIMMVMQTRQLCEILSGRDSGWSTQRRSGGGDAWSLAWRRHRWHMMSGFVAAIVFFQIDLSLFLWLSPTLAGLVFAVPLSWASGRAGAGQWLRRLGLLQTPHEKAPPAIIARRDAIAHAMAPMPGDGLDYLINTPGAIETHVAANLAPPHDTRGQPEAAYLTAARKVADARTKSEALAWLTHAERIWVSADRDMLKRLSMLPENESGRGSGMRAESQL